jgi:hypothetical protein
MSIYIVTQYVFLNYVYPESKNIKISTKLQLSKLHICLLITQILLAFVLISILLQIIFAFQYDTRLIIVSAGISYSISVFMMALLAKSFITWYLSNRKPVVLFYGLATASIGINAALTFSLVDLSLMGQPFRAQEVFATITPYLPDSYAIIYNAFFTSSIISFILTWIATIFMIYHHSKVLGVVTFWILVSIPLAYFIPQFEPSLIFLFDSYRLADPIMFDMIYTIIFAASTTVGGILFAAAFWSIARKLSDKRLRKYTILSGVGLALVFSSNQAIILTGKPYPPFGLFTASYLGLASYLMLVGIYYTALSAAHDSRLRQVVRNSVQTQSNLLEYISVAQMEAQIRNRVLHTMRKTSLEMEADTGVQSSLKEQDIKEYLEEVLKEVKNSRGEDL